MKKQNNVGSVGAAFCLCLSLFYFGACSPAAVSLENYQGKAQDLLPEKVGDFKRTQLTGGDLPLAINKAKEELRVTGTAGAGYASSSNKLIEIRVITFASPDKAKEAFRLFKTGVELNSLNPKEKNGKTVGEKLETELPYGKDGKTSILIWTNGSVLFDVRSGYPEKDSSYLPSTAEDVRQFENQYPY